MNTKTLKNMILSFKRIAFPPAEQNIFHKLRNACLFGMPIESIERQAPSLGAARQSYDFNFTAPLQGYLSRYFTIQNAIAKHGELVKQSTKGKDEWNPDSLSVPIESLPEKEGIFYNWEFYKFTKGTETKMRLLGNFLNSLLKFPLPSDPRFSAMELDMKKEIMEIAWSFKKFDELLNVFYKQRSCEREDWNDDIFEKLVQDPDNVFEDKPFWDQRLGDHLKWILKNTHECAPNSTFIQEFIKFLLSKIPVNQSIDDIEDECLRNVVCITREAEPAIFNEVRIERDTAVIREYSSKGDYTLPNIVFILLNHEDNEAVYLTKQLLEENFKRDMPSSTDLDTLQKILGGVERGLRTRYAQTQLPLNRQLKRTADEMNGMNELQFQDWLQESPVYTALKSRYTTMKLNFCLRNGLRGKIDDIIDAVTRDPSARETVLAYEANYHDYGESTPKPKNCLDFLEKLSDALPYDDNLQEFKSALNDRIAITELRNAVFLDSKGAKFKVLKWLLEYCSADYNYLNIAVETVSNQKHFLEAIEKALKNTKLSEEEKYHQQALGKYKEEIVSRLKPLFISLIENEPSNANAYSDLADRLKPDETVLIDQTPYSKERLYVRAIEQGLEKSETYDKLVFCMQSETISINGNECSKTELTEKAKELREQR
ncbi:hypothetical protein ACFL96_00710 [Thermoproteota archaeon]